GTPAARARSAPARRGRRLPPRREKCEPRGLPPMLHPPRLVLARSPPERGTAPACGRDPRRLLLLLRAQHLRALLHRLDDVDVAGAAAEIALQPVDDLVLGRIRVVFQEARRGHDHARGTEAALQAVAFRERLLY